MATKTDEITIETVTEWLEMMGSTPVEVSDPEHAWHLEFDYPAHTKERIHVVQPLGRRYQIVVATGIHVSADHTAAYRELPTEEQRQFFLGLQRALNRPEVDFKLEGLEDTPDCPRAISLTRSRYADGLSLDSFAKTVGDVFKAKLHAIYFFNAHLNGPDTSGDRFGFKKLDLN